MGNGRWFLAVALGLGAFASHARAFAADTGFDIGARVGYALPLGKVEDAANSNLSQLISGMVPLQLDLGYRVTPMVTVGGYFMYGFGSIGSQLKTLCDNPATTGVNTLGLSLDCSIHDTRLGAQVLIHPSPGQSVDPWFGLGAGYEWTTLDVTASAGGLSVSESATSKGFEFLNLQAGADFSVAKNFGLGPFASFSLGEYSSASASGFASTSASIDKKALHQWFMFGVHGAFLIPTGP